MHDPAKQIKRPTADFSTENAQKHQPTVSSNNKTVVENTINNSQRKDLPNKNSNSRYGQSFNGQNQTNPQRRNLNGSSNNQSFSINQSPDAPKNWYGQLQLIPVSFLKGNKAFDTYALIDPGGQCSFRLDAISDYLELPCESQQSVPLHFFNTENNMTLSKINEIVTITPYKSSKNSFELSRAYSTSSFNLSAANVFQLNQVCDAFNSLRHIHFPYIADGKIAALRGVKAFAFTYPTHVIQGNQHQPFGVKTKLRLTLAGEYENCCTYNHPKSSNLPNKAFVFQVSRNRMDEPELDELQFNSSGELNPKESNQTASLHLLLIKSLSR